MPEELVPPVVAVVASADGGGFLEECLASLRDQDYPNLDILVVDDASATDVTPRVASVLPRAIIRRLPARRGLPAALNQAMHGIDGASFFLFCHDDVALDPDATRRLVEESFRSNAAVVGPKIVAWDDPSRLLQVGLGMTRTGRAVSRVVRGELDQAQRDEASEVFAVPGACMLVRSDLFIALQGFDEEELGFGEDIDLCWRAAIAGARVVVAPSARVRHRLATASGERHRVDAESIRNRNELRSVLKNYTPLRRFAVSLALVTGLFLRFFAGIASRSRSHPYSPVSAIRWNLAHRRSLKEARRALHELRQVPDSEVISRMSRASTARWRRLAHLGGSALPGAHFAGENSFVTGSGETRAGALAEGATRHRQRSEEGVGHLELTGAHGGTALRLSSAQLRAQAHADLDAVTAFLLRLRTGEVSPGPLLAGALLALVVLIGIRSLLFGNLPVVGQLVPLPPASVLLGRYFAGTSSPGWSLHAGPTPPGYAVVGLLGMILGNSSALALKVLLVSGVTVGTAGVARLVRPFGSRWGKLVAAAAFATSPFAWNAMARGDVGASVALAVAPFLLARLARATGLPPFSRVPRAPRASKATTEIAVLSLLLAVGASFSPVVLLVTIAAWACVAVFLLVTAKASRQAWRGSLRSGAVSVGGVVGAVVLMMPWSIAWLVNGSSNAASWSLLTGARTAAKPIAPLADLVGHAGPFGAFWGVFGILIAAGVVLVIGSGDELRWGGALLSVSIGAAALAWVGGRGLVGDGFGDSLALSCTAAASLAGAVGVSATAVERELASHRLGHRHVMAVLGALALTLSAVTGLYAFTSGRSGLPATGYDAYLSWTGSPNGAPLGSRTLWIGQPPALPGAAVQVEPGVAAFTSTSGLPGADQLFPEPPGRPLQALVSDLRTAEAGGTASLGAELAAEGIRYVVVPSAEAPQTPGLSPALSAPPPSSLVGTLQAQTDLLQRVTEAGVVVFQNTAWTPSAGDGPGASASSAARAQLRSGFPSGRWRIAGLVVALLVLALALLDLLGFRRGRHASRKSHRSMAGATA